LPTARILLIVAVAVGILVVAGSAFQVHGRILDGEATVYVDPADQRVSRGDPFTVAIAVKDLSEPLYGYEFTLSFDADLVSVTGVTDARFADPITEGPVTEDGSVRFVALIDPEGTEMGSDADGNLAIIEMEALELGTSDLILSSVQLSNSDGELIAAMVEDGSVTSALEMELVPSHPERWVNPGVFTETVMIHGAFDLGGYEFKMDFDPDVVTVTDVSDAGFLETTGNTLEVEEWIVEDGTLRVVAASDAAGAGPSGDGALAVITLEAIALGDSELDLFDLQVSDTAGEGEIPDGLDGLVHVVPSKVFIWPDESSVNRCDTLEVEVRIIDAVDLAGYEFKMDWDETVFDVLSVEDGGFLEINGRTLVTETGQIDNAPLSFLAASSGGTGDGADGDGALATITLEAIGVGESDLELFDVQLADTTAAGMMPVVAAPGSAEATKEAVEFEFDVIASPQVAGMAFDVTITALNEDGDPAVNFSGPVQLSDTTGTLAPTEVTFAGPEATASMQITKAQTGIKIMAEAVNPCGVTITGESNAFTVDPDVENPESVTIDPDDVTLEAGECQEFTLEGVDAYGNTFDVTDDDDTTYTADGGGTLTDNEFCAETVGDWTVTGTYLTESDEADVTVVPGPVTRVEVMPAEVTLMPMETQQFDAMCYDAFDNENVADCAPTWSVADADAGTIDAAGLFTAGTPDDYPAAVVATVDSVTGTADVTVEPFRLFMPIIAQNYSP
jgi:hypothetical protein